MPALRPSLLVGSMAVCVLGIQGYQGRVGELLLPFKPTPPFLPCLVLVILPGRRGASFNHSNRTLYSYGLLMHACFGSTAVCGSTGEQDLYKY